jgi:hypothetical protein
VRSVDCGMREKRGSFGRCGREDCARTCELLIVV